MKHFHEVEMAPPIFLPCCVACAVENKEESRVHSPRKAPLLASWIQFFPSFMMISSFVFSRWNCHSNRSLLLPSFPPLSATLPSSPSSPPSPEPPLFPLSLFLASVPGTGTPSVYLRRSSYRQLEQNFFPTYSWKDCCLFAPLLLARKVF